MMGINGNFSPAALDRFIATCMDMVEEEIAGAFEQLGAECVERIRNRPGGESWYDRTGNLRSSIGAAVFRRGEKVFETAFETVLGGRAGSARGRAKINSLASKYAELIGLEVVAGMDYAEKVERLENKDVLASATLWANSVVMQRLAAAVEKAKERIAQIRW